MKKLLQLLLFISAITCIHQSAYADLPDYVEKEIWSDSWTVYASEFYNGKQYVVQLYQNDHQTKHWEMRLIELKINDNVTLSDSRYWVLDDGKNREPNNRYYNAAMEEFNGRLFIYIQCNSQNYFYSFQTDNHGNATLTKLNCPVKNNRRYCFSMTKYRNSLAIICGGKEIREPWWTWSEMALEVTFTHDDPGSPSAVWKTGITSKHFEYVENMSYGTNDFDATNWIGVREKYVDGGMKPVMVEELIIGQFRKSDGTFLASHFHGELDDLLEGGDQVGKWKNGWRSGFKLTGDSHGSDGFGLKLVEGQITNVGLAKNAENINNPIQFISAFDQQYVTGNIHQRQIICYEYDPVEYYFKENTPAVTYNFATNLPYGKFGACSVSVPIPDETYEPGGVRVQSYQRYISIFRSGGCGNHFNKHSYYSMIKSNRIKVKRFAANTADLLGSAAGRKACTLVGVIEGAPPTVVDNGPMYREICGATGNVSSIAFGTSESKSVRSENSTTWGHSNVGGFDGYGASLSSFSIMGGGGYEVTKTTAEEKTFTTSHTTSLFNTNADMASTGYYIYIIPQLDQYVGQVYTPDGRSQLTAAGDLLTYVQTGANMAFISYRLDDEKIGDKIRLKKPLDLQSWKERGVELFDNYGNIGRPIYDEYINAITGNVNTLQSTVTNSSTTTKTSSWELMINTHFYRNHSGGSMTWTSSTSSTVGKDVTISINPVSTDYFSMMERDRPIYYYGLQAYCLNDPNNGATREYYDDLIRREIMDKTDTPFIIAWKVVSTAGEIIMSPPMSGIDTAEENGYNFFVEGTTDGLLIRCDAPQTIEIYNTAGVRVASRDCVNGDNNFTLPSGMYVIRNAVKSVKVMRR